MIILVATLVLTLGLFVSTGLPSGAIVLVACAAVPACWIAVRKPQLVTAFTVFVLFINAPVVAIRFHGMPRLLALVGPPAALLFVWGYQLIVRRETVALPRAWPWAIAFLAVELISALFCRYPEVATEILKSHAIEGLGLFLILCNVVRTRESLQQVVWALLLAGALLGGLSLWQQVTGTHGRDYGGFAQVPRESKGFHTGEHQRQRRSAGSLGEQNRYAQNLLMLIPLAVLQSYAASRTWQKLAYVLMALLISAGCILTFSRGAAVAFVLLTLCMWLFGYVQLRHLVAIAGVSAVLLLAFPQLVSRMDSVGTLLGYLRGDKAARAEELDGAIQGRATSMLAALRVTADYPLLGVGPGNFRYHNREYAKVGGFRAHEEDRAAHCLYLHLAAETGLLGLAVFLVMVGVTLYDLHRVWWRNLTSDISLSCLAGGFAMALLAYLLSGFFLHFSFIRFFWLIFALACCVPLVAARQELQRSSRTAA